MMNTPKRHKVELHRGISLFSWGDDIKVHLVRLDPVTVVHIQSRISKGNVQLGTWKNHHWKYERKFLDTMAGFLGPHRCHMLE